MSATRYLFRMASGTPVVTPPAEIDPTTVGELRAILLEWHRRGYTTVVVDMTGTQFCDSAGLRELVWAHKRAVAASGGLRLVLPPDGAVLRVFTVTGLDRLIPHFASREQALAGVPAAGGQRSRLGFPGHTADPPVELSSLPSAIAAMSEVTARLPTVKVGDQAGALAAIGEAVWWITVVDATLVRHHPDVYDAVLAAQAPAERPRIKPTMAGLRFARSWVGRGTGLEEAIQTGGQDAGVRRITQWTWRPVCEPALAPFPPRGQAWELARYQAYQAHLAGRTIGETVGRAVTFLTLTGANTASAPVAGPSL
jgi:anti-sigma B factor antagonist